MLRVMGKRTARHRCLAVVRRPRRSAHRPRRGCRRTPPAPPHRSLGHRSCRASRRRPRPHQPRRQPAVPGRAAGPCVEVDERAATLRLQRAVGRFSSGLQRCPPLAVEQTRGRGRRLCRSWFRLRGRRAANPEPRRRCADLHAAVEDLGLEERAHELVVGAVAQRLRFEADGLGVRRGRRWTARRRAGRRPHALPRRRRCWRRPRPRACGRGGTRERGASTARARRAARSSARNSRRPS